MSKDNQEVERIVEELEVIVGHDSLFVHKGKVINFLRTTLTTYGNSQVEEIIKLAEGMRKDYDRSLEGYNYHSKESDSAYNQALTDLIKAIKK